MLDNFLRMLQDAIKREDGGGYMTLDDELHEMREECLSATHVQQYEEWTCAREVGTRIQLVPEDSSL